MVTPNMPRSVAVIGAGIMGAAIAWRLARRGVQVTLLDKGQPGHGASSHSFAWINAGAKEPIGYHDLNRRSLEMWARFATAIGDDGDPASTGLRWGGKVSWVARAKDVEALVGRVRQLQSWGYPSRLIDAAELAHLEPALELGPVAAAEYSPNEGQVEPQLVVDVCLRRLQEMGCEVRTGTEVVGFERGSDGRIHRLDTSSGPVQVEAVVMAAGRTPRALAARPASTYPRRKAPAWSSEPTPFPRC